MTVVVVPDDTISTVVLASGITMCWCHTVLTKAKCEHVSEHTFHKCDCGGGTSLSHSTREEKAKCDVQ